ncbi:MBL fold metallo-hydrolase [Pseudobacteriovorax antillogorgiicola]|uniref:MBL fold metallo-hydrolase n=1 Tax=Pseudobacteriovorax antillogorgiicola TaxID=1513793 RepID=UPI001F3E2CFE|nr:MBL fold metallo-hydrolase [Pseudobacteriovorax antillogorgiicola]
MIRLNCGSLCPPVTERLLLGRGSLVSPGCLTCRCFLIESKDRLILVDTGLGHDDLKVYRGRFGLDNHITLRPKLDPQQSALRQIERMGYKAADVREIIVTHLDPDHAGGLSDFPGARIHIHQKEWDEVSHQPCHRRYRPTQWGHVKTWQTYSNFGDIWFGFQSCHQLDGVDEDIFLVPLIGHTAGSMGVAVREEDSWHFHAGDAFFVKQEIEGRTIPKLQKIITEQLAYDNQARLQNVNRIAKLHQDQANVFVTCSHDPDL